MLSFVLYSLSHAAFCGPERRRNCESIGTANQIPTLMSMSPPLPPAQATTLPNNVTGRVRKTKEIATFQGGFSDIFEGELDGQKVAIKIFRGTSLLVGGDSSSRKQSKAITGPSAKNADALSPEKMRKRFYRECRLWCQLDHPNVLRLLGISSDWSFNGLPSMISPWCESGNAVQYLQNNPQANRLEITIGTAQGLEYLHSRDVIHGDMKGHNVVIDNQGNARVCDFGRSKVLEQTGYTTKLLATAIYMAPELIDDESADQDDDSPDLFAACLTTASDVYAFGMVALELLTGRTPWEGYEPQTVLVRVLKGQRPRRKIYESLSDEQWAFLLKCWDGQPTSRPAMIDIVSCLLSWQVPA